MNKLDGVHIPYRRGNLGERGAHWTGTFCGELCTNGFIVWVWTRVGRRKHKFNRIRQVALMYLHRKTNWRHLANTTEPSVCGGDTFLCQMTLLSSGFPPSQGNAEALDRWGRKTKHHLISYFLSNSTKNYRNWIMYVRLYQVKGGTYFQTQCIVCQPRRMSNIVQSQADLHCAMSAQ